MDNARMLAFRFSYGYTARFDISRHRKQPQLLHPYLSDLEKLFNISKPPFPQTKIKIVTPTYCLSQIFLNQGANVTWFIVRIQYILIPTPPPFIKVSHRRSTHCVCRGNGPTWVTVFPKYHKTVFWEYPHAEFQNLKFRHCKEILKCQTENSFY